MPNPNPKRGRPFEKGIGGNPRGSSALSREVGNARKLNQVMVTEILNRFVTMSLEDVVAFAQNKTNPAMEVLVASILVHGIKNGDQNRLTFLLDRLIGKVKEVHEHSFIGNVNAAIVDRCSEIAKANSLKGEPQHGSKKETNEEASEETTQEIV